MATTDSTREIPLLRVPPLRDYGTPGWFARLPQWVGIGGVLTLLIAISAFIRAHYLNGQFWSDEANTVGIASHPLTAIPGVLWKGGGAPLYYLLLHVWMSGFVSSEISAHALSVLSGVVVVPVGMWIGWSLYGRRVGLMLATLLAFNPWLTKFAEEARPYELFALFGLVVTGAFIHVFVFRHRRGWLAGLAISLALMVYTDPWGFFMWLALALALIPIWRRSTDRRAIARDALLAFGAAAILFLPWLPTLIHQAGSATAPWTYAPHLGANVLRDFFGSDRVSAILGIAVVAGLVPLLTGPDRHGPEATGVWVSTIVWLGAVVLALVATLFVPALTDRYLAPLAGAILLMLAIACARSGIAGLVLLVASCLLVANPASFIGSYKSDMSEVAYNISPYLRAGDVVLVTQPEQAPLAWYYLPAGLRFATELGPDPHPTYMNWDGAQTRLEHSSARATVDRVVASLRPGQRLVVIRPLTEGVQNWSQQWSQLVRRRSAQLGAVLAGDPQVRQLTGVYAPRSYRGACCTASSALVFVKR
jgi:hypothetical protein